MENLSSDEMPEPWTWPLDWKISEHLEDVREMRKSGTSPNAWKDYEADGGTEKNEYASRFYN